MKRSLSLVVLLSGGLARASGICEEPVKNPLLTFEGDPYFITELNDPEFVPLGTAITYTTKKYNSCANGCANLALVKNATLEGVALRHTGSLSRIRSAR